MLEKRDAARLTRGNHWFRTCMPYHFVHLPSDRFKHLYLPVNRNYKPLGCVERKWMDYRAYASQAVIFRGDPRKLDGVWSDPERLYLYSDSLLSGLDYFLRYERLMSRCLDVAGTKGDLRLVQRPTEEVCGM